MEELMECLEKGLEVLKYNSILYNKSGCEVRANTLIRLKGFGFSSIEVKQIML